MLNRRSANRILPVLGLAGATFALGACASDDPVARFRANPTPKLDTLNETRVEIDNQLTVTADTNFRMLNRDIGWALFLDRPSRLNPIQLPE